MEVFFNFSSKCSEILLESKIFLNIIFFSNEAIQGILPECITHHQWKLFGKTTVRYNYTPTKLSKIKTANVPSVAIYVEKMELSDASGGNVKLYGTLENDVAIPFKVQHTSTIWLSQF